MSNEPAERRSNPRIDINGSMTYRTDVSDDVCQGELENMSLQGARIWIDQELPTASRLRVRVETDEDNQEVMEFNATLIYILPGEDRTMYGYGCSIEETGQTDN
jgi:hypothetical protein